MAQNAWKQREAVAELLWKWILRLAGIGAFAYIVIAKGGNVPAALYVLIGGLIGLPNVIGWQRRLNASEGGE